MTITRDQVIATLDALASPLGPPQTRIDGRLAHQDRWVNEGGVELLEVLLDLVAAPAPPEQIRHASYDDWTMLLSEIAGVLGKRHPDVALPRLLPLLDDARARIAAIDILGSIGDARAVEPLAQMRQHHRLTEDELVHLAGALGEIRGDEACRLLADMLRAATPGQRELQREIDLALRTANCH